MWKRSVVFPLLCLLALMGGYLIGCASGSGQPHMRAAVDHLRSARNSLQKAEADKGGHRVRAIQLVDDAIVEVQSGMEFAHNH